MHLSANDDFISYLFAILPLSVCCLSFLYLLVQLYLEARRSKHYVTYQPLETSNHAWATGAPRQGNLPLDVYDANTDDDDSDGAELNIHLTTSQDNRSYVKVDRPKGELWVVVVEELVVLAELAIHVAILLTQAWGEKGDQASMIAVAVWVYVTALASVRLLFSVTAASSFPRLWFHTAFIYGFFWLFTVMKFRSATIHPVSDRHTSLVIADFALASSLLMISMASRKGNTAVELKYEDGLEPSKEQVASLFSIATFAWVDAIVWRGFKKTYEMADVWNLAPRDKAAAVLDDYRQLRKTTILAWHMLRYFKRGLLIQGAWACFSAFLLFAPTLLLKAILEYIENPESKPRNAAWLYVILLFVSAAVQAIADGQALWVGRKICIRLRAIIIGELYAKALKRKVSAKSEKVLGEKKKDGEEDQKKRSMLKKLLGLGKGKDNGSDDKKKGGTPEVEEGQVSSGAIINLMAVDSFKVADIAAYLHFLWANTPVQAVLAIFLLYRIMGYSSIAGIGMMILLLPVNLYVSKQFAAIQKQILAATDARIHITNEVLSNIRIIKFFAWEQRFISLINEKRAVELLHIRRRYVWWAVAATVWSGAPILITFLSFFVYTVVEKKNLIPSVAFTALSLFQILRVPLDQLADMVAHVQESKVSVDRIEEYLNEPDTDKYDLLATEEYDEHGEPLIGFGNATFTWGSENEVGEDDAAAFRLMNMNVQFQVGKVNVIVGPTGSGKSSVLLALLGEMTKLKGKVHLPGGKSRDDLTPDADTGLCESVAYCAQQAWLINDTIKENILFASPWDPQRYENVLSACSLEKDLEILDAGDETLVGEKGVTLSGGQKQRISLARALYSRARHVLLDDVLSAVDSHTAKWIFDKALLGPLMYDRTCILVTHNVSLCLPHSEYAVVLDNGRLVAQGTPNQVIDSGKLGEDFSRSRPVSRSQSQLASRVPSDAGDETSEGLANGTATANGKADKKKSVAPEESRAVGSVKLGIIVLYLRAMGPWYFWLAAGAVFALQQVASLGTNLWIRAWANAYQSKYTLASLKSMDSATHLRGLATQSSCIRTGTCNWDLPFINRSASAETEIILPSDSAEVDPIFYLGVYAAIGVGFMIVTLSREGILFGGSLTASRKVHQRLLETVTHAKFRFFDSTPLGQLMNRFSKDVENLDQEIAPVAVGVVHCFASIVTVVVLISVITPGFLIAGFFISVLYFFIGRFYINSSRDLKRLESVQRSPLYQLFGETLSGMVTIRAYGDERRFVTENLRRVNSHNRPFIYLWATNRWLAFRVDVIGALVSFFAGVFVLLNVGKVDPGAAGLALSYAVTFTENVLWFVRLYASNEQNMNSMERIKEYLDVDQEAPPIMLGCRPPANWPSQGSVEFIGYSTRYREDFDMVLKQVTFKILPGEKVGVVGRTGAGKSSLALALFRALEAEEGKILVDSVDIGLIGLQDLRENIVMVPQGMSTNTFLSEKSLILLRSHVVYWDNSQQSGSIWALYRRRSVHRASPCPTDRICFFLRNGYSEKASRIAQQDAGGN